MILSGPAVVIGEDVDTDMIIAGRYLRTVDAQVWVSHVFEDYDESLASRLRGAILVAGKNIGCGSSREQAAAALKEAGVVAIAAPSFARIFFRNCVNLGIPVFETDALVKDNEMIEADMQNWTVQAGGVSYPAKALSERMQRIIECGGLAGFLSQEMRT